ncbi:MAG TPA: deoxyhypusine synthase family protein [Myxococcales bacterium]|nr:MAG: deoxyhypusine synthase [Deltaproteobacteria bacterium]HMC35607.1 deoxyhypusine synthase family protein [Myxococcales bacterium]
MASKRQLRKPFEKARRVDPRPITGRENARDLLDHAFSAYVGRQVRTAYQLMRRSMEEDASIFLTLSGAMTPAGLHQSCLIPLIERGVISCLTTTGANLYHDAHRIIGHAIREVNPDAGDLQLRLARVIRIYDLGFWEEALLDTDRLFSALMQGPDYQRKMTTPEFHALLGRDIGEMERALGVKQPSLLSSVYEHGVPIFVGAVQDGSIFLNAVKLKRLFPEQFKFEIDINEDVYSMAAVQHWARHRGSKRLAIWILGGGVPKNYTLQGEPLLDQILFVPTTGFDIDLQFCVDPVDNGALSSCPAGEGHTWGKVSVEAVEAGSVYVHTDVTAVFPWLTHALLSDPRMKRKPKRLLDSLSDARSFLDRDVAKNRKELLKTLSFPGAPTKHDPESVVR